MSGFYPVRDQIDPFINLKDDPNYKPKTSDEERIKEYKDIR